MNTARTFFLSLLVFSAGCVLAVQQAVSFREYARNEIVDVAAEVTGDVREDLDLLLGNILVTATAVANDLDDGEVQTDAQAAVNRAGMHSQSVRTILVLNDAGHVLADKRPDRPAVGMSVRDRDYVQALLQPDVPSFYLGTPVFSRVDGTWTVPLSVPAQDPDGSLRAIVVVSVDAGYFSSVVYDLQRSGLFGVLLDNRTGLMVPLNGGQLSAEQTIIIADARQQFDPGNTVDPVVLAVTGDGPRDIVLAVPLERIPFSLVGLLPQGSLLAASRDAARSTLLLGLSVSGLLAALLVIGLNGYDRMRSNDRRASRLESRLRVATEAGRIGLWDYDILSDKLVWDDTMFEVFDLPKADFDGTFESWRRCVHPDDVETAVTSFMEAVEKRDTFDDSFRILWRDGQVRFIKARATVTRNPQGKAIRVVGANYDVTEHKEREDDLKQANARIEKEARHDPLTGLANRRGLMEDLARRQNGPVYPGFTVFSLDLDRFKQINDMYGHEAGDEVLNGVAEALRRDAGPDDCIARIGGDEFVVVSDGPHDESSALDRGQRLLAAANMPTLWNSVLLDVGASVGYACSGNETTIDGLLRNADLALYSAKQDGRSRIRGYTKQLAAYHRERMQLGDELRAALRYSDLTPFYQPQINAQTGELHGVEVLARWPHGKRGLLLPGKFLPISNELRLTEQIDHLMLDLAVDQVLKVSAGPLTALPKVSVNISAPTLLSDDIKTKLESLPERDRRRISLEIVETVFIDDTTEDLVRRVEAFREMGVGIEIDDFGSGHASITSILALRPDVIKLDQSFTQAIEHDASRLSVVELLVRMGGSVQTPVIAEGIESACQAKLMAELGCLALQGNFFAAAMPVGQLREWLSRHGDGIDTSIFQCTDPACIAFRGAGLTERVQARAAGGPARQQAVVLDRKP